MLLKTFLLGPMATNGYDESVSKVHSGMQGGAWKFWVSPKNRRNLGVGESLEITTVFG